MRSRVTRGCAVLADPWLRQRSRHGRCARISGRTL